MAVRLILYGLLAWVVVSVPVALLFGRLCSLRDGWPASWDQEMATAGATAERDGTRFDRALDAVADRRPSETEFARSHWSGASATLEHAWPAEIDA